MPYLPYAQTTTHKRKWKKLAVRGMFSSMKIYITIEGKQYMTATILNVSGNTTGAVWGKDASFTIHCVDVPQMYNPYYRKDDILGYLWLNGVLDMIISPKNFDEVH